MGGLGLSLASYVALAHQETFWQHYPSEATTYLVKEDGEWA